MSDQPATETSTSETAPAGKNNRHKLMPVLVTAGIIVTGIIIIGLFKEEIKTFGVDLITRYGQGWVDVILFLLTAVSSTPLALPIWGYAQAGVALGYNVVRLASIMAVGSALGSMVTYAIGRYFGNSRFVLKRFPDVHKHPWTEGRSKKYVTLFLFLGTASPIPCDVLYAACGFKRYPAALFVVTMVAARFVRYMYLGYGFKYAVDLF